MCARWRAQLNRELCVCYGNVSNHQLPHRFAGTRKGVSVSTGIPPNVGSKLRSFCECSVCDCMHVCTPVQLIGCHSHFTLMRQVSLDAKLTVTNQQAAARESCLFPVTYFQQHQHEQIDR